MSHKYKKLTWEEDVRRFRENEDSQYRTLVPGKLGVRRRFPLTKQTKIKMKYFNIEYTFLQYHYLVFNWARLKSGLSYNELDVLLYVHPINTFSADEFRKLRILCGNGNRGLLKDWIRKGFIVKFDAARPLKGSYKKTFYSLTNKANHLIGSMYKKLLAFEDLGEAAPERSKMRFKNARETARYENLLQEFNNKIIEKDKEKNGLK